jgi:hypothetical protein
MGLAFMMNTDVFVSDEMVLDPYMFFFYLFFFSFFMNIECDEMVYIML